MVRRRHAFRGNDADAIARRSPTELQAAWVSTKIPLSSSATWAKGKIVTSVGSLIHTKFKCSGAGLENCVVRDANIIIGSSLKAEKASVVCAINDSGGNRTVMTFAT